MFTNVSFTLPLPKDELGVTFGVDALVQSKLEPTSEDVGLYTNTEPLHTAMVVELVRTGVGTTLTLTVCGLLQPVVPFVKV